MPLASTIEIVLADHRQLICEGIVAVARGRAGLRIAAVARSRRELLAALEDGPARLVLLNPHLEPNGAVDLLQELRRVAPAAPVLVLASDGDNDDPVGLLRAGARGYLSRDNDMADLFNAVGKIALGGLYVNKELGERIAADLFTRPHSNAYGRLSPREAEVFGLLARGRTVSQIAVALDLSVKTVSTHKSRLMIRLGLRTLSELVQCAIAEGVIAPPAAAQPAGTV